MKPKPIQIVSALPQLRALQSPVRHEIVSSLAVLGVCSVREIAESMGRVPETLYYHVQKLVDVGLVTEQGQRAGARRPETLYELIGLIEIDQTRRSKGFLEALGGLYGSALRFATRRLLRSLAAERPRTGARRQGLVQYRARLDERSLAELKGKLNEIVEFMEQRGDPDVTEATLITIAFSSARESE